MQLFKFTLTIPLSKAAFVQSLLDAYDIPFSEDLDTSVLTSRGLPGRCFVAYAEPPQRETWEGLLARHDLAGFLTVDPFDYDPGDWVERWKAYYEWSKISSRLAVGPDFKPCPFDVATQVALTPGQSFGSGVHESTRIALTLIDQYLPPAARVLDAGCGTGVLAVCAARLGASHVVAFDIETEAITETIANAAANQVDVEAFCGTADAVSGRFDLVVANMLAFRLVSISAALRDAVRPGGVLVLAGLVTNDLPRFPESFFPAGHPFVERRRMTLGDWWGAAYSRHPA